MQIKRAWLEEATEFTEEHYEKLRDKLPAALRTAAVLAERERCAKIAEEAKDDWKSFY